MHSRQHLGALTLLLLACCAVVLAGPVPAAWAHSGTARSASFPAGARAPSAPAVTVFAQGAGDGALWGVVLALAALALLFRVPRRLVTAVLIVLLAVLAFETGVHAVHHIGDGRTTARCPVASMAPHLGGTTVTPATSGLALQPSVDGVVVTDALVPVLRSLGPAQGRSPPSLAS